jgi:acyl dehydratase
MVRMVDGMGSVIGRAFEDFHRGDVIDLGNTVVDRDEMLAFARRFDPQPFHTDEAAARASVLGGLCASGWFTCSRWMRAYADAVLAGSTSQGSPGGRELAWPAPVFPGDELACRAEIGSVRESRSRPGLGLVEVTGTAWRGETRVLGMTFTGIFGARE